jgi:hypothetical protein
MCKLGKTGKVEKCHEECKIVPIIGKDAIGCSLICKVLQSCEKWWQESTKIDKFSETEWLTFLPIFYSHNYVNVNKC